MMDMRSVQVINLKEKFRRLATMITQNCKRIAVDTLKMKNADGDIVNDSLTYYKFSNIVVHCIKDTAVRLDVLDQKGSKLYGIPLSSKNDGRLITSADKPLADISHETISLLSLLVDDKTTLLEMYLLEKEMWRIVSMLSK